MNTRPTSIVFFGTSPFAAYVLRFLLQQTNVEIAAIVTRPDRSKGRELKLGYSAVKEAHQELNLQIPLYQPEKASTEEFEKLLSENNADLFVVVAYGEIIKQNLLNLPKLGCINIHASALPKFRGAAPMQRCLMAGESETGITIIEMTAQMDAGDILALQKIPIPMEMTALELEEKLRPLSCELLIQVIEEFRRGSVKKIPQVHQDATFAPKITPADEKISWNQPALTLHNQIRALSPKPGAWCEVRIGSEKKRLKIKRALVVASAQGTPGEILSQGHEEMIIACAEGGLKLLEVQLEGKKTLPINDFLRGLHHVPAFI